MKTLIYSLILCVFASLFACSSKPASYMSEQQCRESRHDADERLLAILSEHGITPASRLSVDATFYSDARDKVAALAAELQTLGYRIDQMAPTEDELWILSAATPRMPMDLRGCLDF